MDRADGLLARNRLPRARVAGPVLSRRSLFELGAMGLVAGVAGCRRDPSENDRVTTPEGAAGKPGGPMHILVLGGTGFLGPHFVEAAQAKGHTLTLFNRGKTNPQLFPDIEKLQGDRKTGDLKALEGRRFDAVLDTSGYVPRHVTATAELLKDSGQYVFVSSASAYRDQHEPGLKEGDPVAPHPDPGNEEVMTYYGPLKALCEQAAEDVMPGRVTVVRPGLIVGPGDPTDRFTYWPVRVARGGEIMAPGKPSDPVQFIDVRDLAAFLLTTIEQRRFELYNAIGPQGGITVEGMIEGCIAAIGSKATLTWVDAEFLAAQQVEPWMHMTVWVPPDSEFGGLGAVDGSKAFAAGLSTRSVGETAKDTLAWWEAQPEERKAKPEAGLSAEREASVLAAWHGRASATATTG